MARDHGLNGIAQAVLIPDPLRQTGVEHAASDDLRRQHQGRVVGIRVAEFEVLTGPQDGVGLVGRFELDVLRLGIDERGCDPFERSRTFPVTEGVLDRGPDGAFVEVTDQNDVAVLRSPELLVEGACVGQRDGPEVGHGLVDRLGVARVPHGAWVHDARKLELGESLRIGTRLLDRRDPLFPDDLEFLFGERRLSGDLAHQPDDVDHVVSNGLKLARREGRAPADAALRLKPVELVLDRLAITNLGPTHEHRSGHAPGRTPAHEGRLVSKVQPHAEGRAIPPRFLRQQRDLNAIRELVGDGARVHVAR